MPLYALIDCNNFYASCERVFNPSLEGKPIVILSSNDGCVIARSQESKSLNIEMGIPVFKIKKLIADFGVHAISSNFELYGDLSARVMDILANSAPDIEIYSIDEAFLDFTGFCNVIEYSKKLREKVKQWTGIPVSIGLAPTKTLGKLANMIAKKRTTTGVFQITKNNLSKVLTTVDVGEIWGIGRKTAIKLKSHGIYTAEQLRTSSPVQIRKLTSITGSRIISELNAIPALELEDIEPRQSIQSSRSFGKEITEIEDINSAVSYFVMRATEKLREQNSIAGGVYVYIRTNPHKKYTRQYQNGLAYNFEYSSDNTSLITGAAIRLVKKLFIKGYSYKKAGVMLTNITDKKNAQKDLFSHVLEDARSDGLMNALDNINRKYGNGTLFLATQGTQLNWQSKREAMSPRYSTRWDELKICN